MLFIIFLWREHRRAKCNWYQHQQMLFITILFWFCFFFRHPHFFVFIFKKKFHLNPRGNHRWSGCPWWHFLPSDREDWLHKVFFSMAICYSALIKIRCLFSLVPIGLQGYQWDRRCKERGQKKTGLCGENSQVEDPPPSLGNPCYQKKVGFIFHFRTSGTFLVFTKKSPFWVIDWNYVVGIGEPPLRDARFLHFPQKENIVKC